jgi:mono/diheme cytochrome c family protein
MASAQGVSAITTTPAVAQRDTSAKAASATAKKKTVTRRQKASARRTPKDTIAGSRSQSASSADKLAVTPAGYNGWKVFAVNCTRCHGEDAIGSALAPSLVKSLQSTVTHDIFVQTVKEGRPPKGMPPWGPLLTDKQIEDLYAYVKARSDGRLAPGRPHVRQGN